MNIGILGAGSLGTALARRLIAAGHRSFLSFSRDAARTALVAQQIGAKSGTPREAATFADVVALTAPWTAVEQVLQQAGALEGKILWDCTNPLLPDSSGLMLGTDTSAAEEVARRVPHARIVKAIPPFAEVLQDPPRSMADARPATFVCGDDPAANGIVSELVVAIGAEPVDAGRLTAARFTEPAAMLLVHLAYKQGLGGRIGSRLLRFT
jgi:predicted dinucleotide-binding enzyme